MVQSSDQAGRTGVAPTWNRAQQVRAVLLIAAVVLGLALLIWAVRRWQAPASPPELPPAPAGTFRPTSEQYKTLTVATVAAHAFRGIEVTDGQIALNGDRTTAVYSPFSGRVTRVIAKPGDALKRGAPLCAIDASEFVQGQNDLVAAVAAQKLARASESRKHALYDAQGGSLQDWQAAQADLATAEVALKAARNRLRILGKSETQIDALESGAHVDASAFVAAPIDGVVVDRQVGPGQYLQAGSGTAIYTMADLSSVWLVANVRESDAPLVRVGQPIEVSVAAFPGRTFAARITYVAASVDPDTHRLTVRAQIANPDGGLKPQMFATFRIVTSTDSETPAVPESAVVYDGTDAHVWVVREDAGGPLIGIRPIKTGRSEQGDVQVLAGLKAGERIVTRGSLFIDRAVTGE